MPSGRISCSHTPDEHNVQTLGRFFSVWSSDLSQIGTAQSQTALHTRHTITRGAFLLTLGKIRRHICSGIFSSLLTFQMPPRKPMSVLPFDLSIHNKRSVSEIPQ